MPQFKISKYTKDGDIMLVRIKESGYGNGLPPTSTQTILMNEYEIDDLIEELKEYANERRNTTV
jgi:hypothetical protein